MNSLKSIPLYIKVPVGLAAFLVFFLVFVTVFENVPKDDAQPLMCKLKSSGEMKLGTKVLPMVTHLFQDPEGRYIVGAFDSDKDSFYTGKINIPTDLVPYGEILKSQESILRSQDKHKYTLESSQDRWALVKDENMRRIPLNLLGDQIVAKAALGLCAGNWSNEINVQQINDSYLMIWNGLGQIGFYDLSKFYNYTPKGVPRAADLMMVAEFGNSLNVGDCRKLAENSKARVRAKNGIFGFSSGETNNISLYSVQKDKISLQPITSPLKSEAFSDFMIGSDELVGFKTSSWLDRNESWEISSLSAADSSGAKKVLIGKPLGFKNDYSLDGKRTSSYWVSEMNRHLIGNNVYKISKVTPDGNKATFVVEDQTSINALDKKGFWTVLPGNRHLMLSSSEGHTQYTIIECE